MQDQAIDIWTQATDLRRVGRNPSIDDFAKLVQPVPEVPSEAPINKSQQDMNAFDLPITRCTALVTSVLCYHLETGRLPSTSVRLCVAVSTQPGKAMLRLCV